MKAVADLSSEERSAGAGPPQVTRNEIIRLLRSHGVRASEIAKTFGLSVERIYQICREQA